MRLPRVIAARARSQALPRVGDVTSMWTAVRSADPRLSFETYYCDGGLACNAG